MIGDFTGSKTAQFPFSLAKKTDQNIYSTDCVPDAFVLDDPDHIKTDDINRLYNLWLQRQSDGLSPFIILHANSKHGTKAKKPKKGKGKQKASWVEVGSDDEDVRSEEEEEVEMEEPVKIGPPSRKGKSYNDAGPSGSTQKVVFSQRIFYLFIADIISNLQVKTSNGEASNGRVPVTKKRKPEDDLIGPKQKVAKTDGPKKRRGKQSKPGKDENDESEIGRAPKRKNGDAHETSAGGSGSSKRLKSL